MHTYLDVDKLKQRAAARTPFQLTDIFHLFSGSQVGGTTKTAKDLKAEVQEVYNQGSLGSCTANAFCGAYRMLCTDKTFKPSRLYVYYHERLLENGGCVPCLDDTGADAIDGERFVHDFGVCKEDLWPYDIAKYNNTPPKECDDDALQHKLKSFHQIKPTDIKSCINNNVPVLLAVVLYPSFEKTGSDGIVSMPHHFEKTIGGHEMVIVGYDDHKELYTVLNSWGNTWGDHGYCYFPYAYITNHNLCVELTTFTL